MRRAWVLAACVGLAAAGFTEAGRGAWIHAKALLAQHLLAEAWARTLAGEPRAKPWPWADTWPVARLRVPGRGVDLIVLAGANGASLPFGPGVVEGSTGPGEAGDLVLAAHRDTHFRFLERLRSGDRIELEDAAGLRHAFRVDRTRVLDADAVPLALGGVRPRLVLVTCYPFGGIAPGTRQRYLVSAVPTGD